MNKRIIIQTKASSDRVIRALRRARIKHIPIITLSPGLSSGEEFMCKHLGLTDRAVAKYKRLVGE